MTPESDVRLSMVIEAEAYLSAAKVYLEELQVKVKECSDSGEKKKLENTLEQDRIRFAQMMCQLVLFKAKYGIFTEAHKRLD